MIIEFEFNPHHSSSEILSLIVAHPVRQDQADANGGQLNGMVDDQAESTFRITITIVVATVETVVCLHQLVTTSISLAELFEFTLASVVIQVIGVVSATARVRYERLLLLWTQSGCIAEIILVCLNSTAGLVLLDILDGMRQIVDVLVEIGQFFVLEQLPG